jgi:hypothetical protein
LALCFENFDSKLNCATAFRFIFPPMFPFSATITETAEPVAKIADERSVSRVTGSSSHETIPQQQIAYNQ